jgi:hypothetical protein
MQWTKGAQQASPPILPTLLRTMMQIRLWIVPFDFLFRVIVPQLREYYLSAI